MGIDIEMYAETFDGERWKPSESLVENEDYDPVGDPLQPKLRPQSIFSSRIRELFPILERGIVPCRGLPLDVSSAIAAFEKPRHDDGLICHNWLSLEELLSYDWVSNLAVENRIEFCNEVLPKLQCFGSPKFVRIIFWFNG